MRKKRESLIIRKTAETKISLRLNLDGDGKSKVKTPLGFLNHMLEIFAKHGLFNLNLRAEGDTEVDIHHTNEDIAICLGLALKKALTDKKGIRRFGFASIPLDDALAQVSLDLNSRPYLKFNPGARLLKAEPSQYSLSYLKQFLQAFVNNGGLTLHVEIVYREDPHHIIEAIFKALAKALREAVTIDHRIKGILSTKGIL